MENERLFAIPDIHGRADLLCDVLNKLTEEAAMDLERDKIIFLGDMIDRGPNSKEVLESIKSMTEEFPGRVIALAGNHEDLCLNAYARRPHHHDMELWLWNGGGYTQRSFPGNVVPTSVREWIASLPVFHEEPGFFFSHAPAPRENRRDVMNQGQPFTREELTWTYDRDEWGIARNFAKEPRIADIPPIPTSVGVCGHVHGIRNGILEPRLYDHYIYADAGCGCSDKAPLVAIEVKSRTVYKATPG